MSNQSMIRPTCTGCGKPGGGRYGKVTQRDLGSADKWHSMCYRNRNKAMVVIEYVGKCAVHDWQSPRTSDKDFAEYHADCHNRDKHGSKKAPNRRWINNA